jgi:selenium-dependent molybdenum hydroxylase 1
MYKLDINGKEYESEKDMALLDFLREELHIHSVKDGCHEGACGTCTVIIDNKAVRACVQKLSRLQGKKIQTIEGFTDRERDVFGYAFAAAGSVQCGFCIPGMVIAGKCLIDKNPDPTREDVKNAIKTNICRCTGYTKIEDGILLAAKMLRENIEVPEYEMKAKVGERIFRVDAKDKTLGKAKYSADYYFDDMLYAKNLFTKYPRAKILSMDISKALEAPGVVAIFTAKDIPGSRYIGHLAKDWPGMIDVGEETKCIGDTLAMVVAKTKEDALNARTLIEVEYEVLEPIRTMDEAAAKDAYLIHGEGFMQFGNFRKPENNIFDHEVVNRGNADKAIENSKYVAHAVFNVPPTEHAFMEPETAVGVPDGDDGIMVITGGQGIYDEKHELSEYLGIPMEKVRIHSAIVGGGFGGKEDMSVQHQAALCAFLLKKPVKVSFSRQESINYHPKRHAMKLDVTMGCDENGIIQGTKAIITSDTGAYASLGGPVLQRACTHAGGPYAYTNFNIQGDAYYTNNPPAGAFRGFGVTQSVAAVECLVNDLARQVGIDGWEMRYRNAIVPGKSLPNGQIADEGTAFLETLLAVKDEFYKYENDPDYYVGIASAMKNAGIGVGLKDPGRCNLLIKDEKIYARSSAAAIGQGVHTVILQMVGEVLGFGRDTIIVEAPDTSYAPDAGTTTASRQTVFTGQAARQAALELKKDLDSGKTLKDLEGKLYIGEFDFKTDPITSDKEFPVSHIAYGYATHLYIIDKEGKLVKVIAAHDSGTIINPLSCEGQVEGGIAMGIGYGLTEDFPLKDSVPNVKLATLGLIKAPQMPEIETIFVQKNSSDNAAFGAKGIGEIVCTLGAPALQNAYFKKDGVFRTDYPLQNTYYKKAKK